MRSDLDGNFFISSCGDYGVVVYDLMRDIIDEDFTLYAKHLQRKKKRDVKTILLCMYQLRRFKEFMILEKTPLTELSERHLEKFQKEYLEKLSQGSVRTSVRTRKRTVNTGLVRIYEWLNWMKDTNRSDEYLIGSSDCRIGSTKSDRDVGRNRKTQDRDSRGSCPILYKGVGSKSKHKQPGFVPSEKVRTSFIDELSNRTSIEFIAQRNVLFQEIVNATGLRRESVMCLRVEQFAEEIISACEDDYLYVAPDIQKFDYETRYDFPLWLAYRVRHFINDQLEPLMEHKGWNTVDSKGAIFISHTTGKPLTAGTMTKIFSTAFRKLGSPPGAAVHCLRHKFVHDEIERETEYRRSKDLDTSVLSIAEAVSLKVGHTSADSIHPYVVSSQSRSRKR